MAGNNRTYYLQSLTSTFASSGDRVPAVTPEVSLESAIARNPYLGAARAILV